MASNPARARLLWATLLLALPVTFGHTTPCRTAILDFLPQSISSRKIPPLVSVFCTILQHLELRSSTRRSGYRKLWFRPGDTPPTPFPAPHGNRTPHEFSEHLALRQSCVLCTPCAPQTPRTGSTFYAMSSIQAIALIIDMRQLFFSRARLLLRIYPLYQ